MNPSAQVLFELIDRKIDEAAKETRNQIFSMSRNMPWTPEMRKTLQPIIRQELESFILQVLKLCDNVGGVLPEEVSGWTICDASDGADIATNDADYADMWRDYLLRKTATDTE